MYRSAILAFIIACVPIVVSAQTVIMSFAGDCTLGTDPNFGYEDTLPAVIDANAGDMSYVFKNVSHVFGADDLTVVNLEGTFTTRNSRQHKSFTFKGSPEYVKILKAGRIEAVNLANNHSYDFGEEGYRDTIATLTEAGVAYFDEDTPAVLSVKNVRFVFLSYLGFDTEIEDKLREDIQRAKAMPAIVIVSFHWGDEGSYFPNSVQQYLAHKSIDYGADSVIGHHPHVLQGLELYKGRPIAYSLGNFAFGGNANPWDKRSGILQLQFEATDNRMVAINLRILPVRISSVTYINNYQPTLLEGQEKDDFWRWYSNISPLQVSDSWAVLHGSRSR